MYTSAFQQSKNAFEVACSEYPVGAWQRALAAVELDGFRRIEAMPMEKRQKLKAALDKYHKQTALIRDNKTRNVIVIGEQVLNDFSELLGEDSYLAVREMGRLMDAYSAVNDMAKFDSIVALRLAACKRTRGRSDPEWIYTKARKARRDIVLADSFWGAKKILDECLEDCRKDEENYQLSGLMNHILSRYYGDIGEYSTALKYSKDYCEILGSNSNLNTSQSYIGRLQFIRMLAQSGKEAEAKTTLDALERDMAASTSRTTVDLARCALVHAELEAILQNASEATKKIDEAKEYFAKLHEKSDVVPYRCSFIEGTIAIQNHKYDRAEQFLEAGIKDAVSESKGDHPAILPALKQLVDVKVRLGKKDEAVQLVKRAQLLSQKIAEAGR
ncbi:MAG: hypothetical protein K8R36_05825 [Planctomycetales bacterium]|nr:hypothetical protein [Planctomycetales bacterium]